jgi:hypothetical protein
MFYHQWLRYLSFYTNGVICNYVILGKSRWAKPAWALALRDDAFSKQSTIHQFQPDWMKDEERVERGNIAGATKVTKKNLVEQAKRHSDSPIGAGIFDQGKGGIARAGRRRAGRRCSRTSVVYVLLEKSIIYHSACVVFMHFIHADLSHLRQDFNNHVYSRLFV